MTGHRWRLCVKLVMLIGVILGGAGYWMWRGPSGTILKPPGLSAALAMSPNLLLTPERLAFLQSDEARRDPVLEAARNQLIQAAEGMLGEAAQPITGALKVPGFYTDQRETQRAITRALRVDARATHTLALAHTLTGNPAYAEHAKRFLFDWVDRLTHAEDAGPWWKFPIREHRGDTPLVIAYSFPAFIYAFDLLRGAGALSSEEENRFRAWLQVFVDYHSEDVFYKNNHHNWQVVFWLTAAHALEDPDLFHRAAVSYRRGLWAQIRVDGALPRELWRGPRCGTYTLMALEGMTQAVHLLKQHGYDEALSWDSRQDATLQDAIAFYCTYLDDPDTWKQHTNADELNVPKHIADWGYFFELPASWWGEEPYAPYLTKRPYGVWVERCYTLDYATLLFYRSGTNEEITAETP